MSLCFDSLCSSAFQIGCYAAMKKKIYAMGGGSYGKLFESVECYDPRTQQWTAICPLKERRFVKHLYYLGQITRERFYHFDPTCPPIFRGYKREYSSNKGTQFCTCNISEVEPVIFSMQEGSIIQTLCVHVFVHACVQWTLNICRGSFSGPSWIPISTNNEICEVPEVKTRSACQLHLKAF